MLLCFVSMQAALGTRPAAYWFSNPLFYAGLVGFGLLSLYMRRIGSALPFAWTGVAMLSLYALACALAMEPTPRMAMLSLPWFIVIPLVATPFWTYLPLSMLSQAGCALAACLAFWRSGADGPLWMAFGMQVVLGIVAAALVFHVMEHGRRNHYRAEMELERLSRIDPLTQVMNRRHFIEMADKEIARSIRHARPLSLCIVDVDLFKPVNDRYGHISGDEVLRQIAELLRGHARSDDLAARIGGEEFALLLSECDATAASTFAERLREAVASAVFTPGGEPQRITISIGIAELSPGRDTRAALMAAADAALYRAKSLGRNRVCVEMVSGTI